MELYDRRKESYGVITDTKFQIKGERTRVILKEIENILENIDFEDFQLLVDKKEGHDGKWGEYKIVLDYKEWE